MIRFVNSKHIYQKALSVISEFTDYLKNLHPELHDFITESYVEVEDDGSVDYKALVSVRAPYSVADQWT